MHKLYNGNALQFLQTLEDNSVDMIATDVPYKITAKGNTGTMGGVYTNKIAMQGKIFENNDIKPAEYLSDFYRVLKDGSHCYIMINNLNLQEMLNEATKVGFHFVKSLIWDKQAKICGRYYMNCFEYILFFRKGKDKQIIDCSTPDILTIPIKKMKDKNGKNIHDTEKPVKLMEVLVLNSSKEGETVFDPFMGIGSTGVASVRNGRKFIGCEIEKKYYDIAENRIKKTESIPNYKQPSLFDDFV